MEKLKRVKPAENKEEKAPEARFNVLKKTPAELTKAEIESLARENSERLKELIREKGKQIGNLSAKIREINREYGEIFSILHREVIDEEERKDLEKKYKELFKEIDKKKGVDIHREVLQRRLNWLLADYGEKVKKKEEARAGLAQLKKIKEKLEKYD